MGPQIEIIGKPAAIRFSMLDNQKSEPWLASVGAVKDINVNALILR
jgi:hypothetical protein